MLASSSRLTGAVVAIVLLLAACTSQPAPTNPPPSSAPVPTAAVAATQTAAATATPLATTTLVAPTATTAVSPTPTPLPATAVPSAPAFTQMTAGGCCVQPFISPDGAHVLYLDKPSATALVGIWAVTITQPLAGPMLYTRRLGPFNADMSLNAYMEDGRTVVERASDGVQWVIDNGGRHVQFSPDNKQIAWVVGEQSGNFDVRRDDIWLANVDGSNPRQVATLYGGGITSWFGDGARMLVSGKLNRADLTSTLSILNLAPAGGTPMLTKLMDVDRARSILLSPDNRHIVYYVSQARDETQDGMYLFDTATPDAAPQRLDFFGAYHWCSPTRLYYVPMRPEAPANELWRFDLATNRATAIISPSADSPFKISNGDWESSADGKHLVYVNASDHNIWLVTLPDAC